MHNSVQTGFCNELALEHIIPVCNGKLAGQDECFPVVPVIYDLFKVMLYLSVQLDHPKIIYDQKIMCVKLSEEICLPSFQMYKLQVLDEHVHREVQSGRSCMPCHPRHRRSRTFRSLPVR